MTLGITLLNWGSELATNVATRARGVSLILESIARLKPVVNREPTWVRPRFFLDDCYRTLAEFCDQEGRFVEALQYWDMGTDLADGEPRQEFRTCQALDLARLGEHRKAWNLIRTLEPSLTTLVQHYRYSHRLVAACSLCVLAAEKDQSLSAGERADLVSPVQRQGRSPFLSAFWNSRPPRVAPPTARSCARTRTCRPCSTETTFRRCSRMRRRFPASAPPPLQRFATVSEQIEVDQFFEEDVVVRGHR